MKRICKRIGTLIQAVITILLAFVLICNLYLFIMNRVVGVAHPTIFGYSTAVVASGSMEPALSVDDLIFNHVQTDYEEGDIITFQNGDSLTTHRIIAVTEEGYVTQGDANNTPDQNVVAPEAVIGRVVGTMGSLGRWLYFLKTPFGMTLLVFTGFLLIELPFLFRKQREQTDGEVSQHENKGEK